MAKICRNAGAKTKMLQDHWFCGKEEEEKGVSVMKKMILALALALIATPAMAVVNISVVDMGECKAAINYEVVGETELVRAFALDIQATGANIIGCEGFMTGVSVAGGAGYGIFPANFSRFITVNPDGTVADWEAAGYSPVADPCDPGALGGLGTDGITIEMGSLYDGDANKPANSGTLCTIEVDGTCTVTITLNGIRGNVVLENAAEPTVDLSAATAAAVSCGGCFPDTYSTHADWVTLGSPLCWCNSAAGGTGSYQCDGDADGATETIFKYRVYTNDLQALIDNWTKKIDDADLDPCADFDHKSETIFKYRVYTNDLQKLIDNWTKKDAALPGDCPRLE